MLVDRVNSTNAAFRIASSDEERSAALRAYQDHLSSFSSLPAAEQRVSHHHLALTLRMIGECHMSLQRWREAKRSLLAAHQHCDDAIDSLPPAAFAYDELMQQQQIHHLLATTYVELSEEAADAEASCDLASTALTFAGKAEEEAAALLPRCSAVQEAEVNEALLSARINLGIVLIRLRDLAASAAVAVALPDDLRSAATYSQRALRHLKDAYRAAKSFSLHQYQHLAYWHQYRLHVKDGLLPEALRCIRLALDVFVRLEADSRSRELEWADAAWQRERADTRMAGAELIMTMVQEAVEAKDDEGMPLQERQRELRRGREWLRAVKETLRGGEVQLSDEEKSRLEELWQKMGRLQAVHRGIGQPEEETAKAAAVTVADGDRERKRRRIIED